MSEYTVTFHSVGRHRVEPLTLVVTDADSLALEILAYTEPLLPSGEVTVNVDLKRRRGEILCDSQVSGGFSLIELGDGHIGGCPCDECEGEPDFMAWERELTAEVPS